MNKPLRISALALATTLTSQVAQASDVNAIERMTITGNQIQQAPLTLLTNVTAIHAEDITRLGVYDLPSVLQKLSFLDVVRSGGYAQQTDVFSRGATSKHQLVLIDNVPVGDANSGAKALANIPLAMVARIEVLRGARAAIYGADAIAGVINIITKTDGRGVDASIGTERFYHANGYYAQDGFFGLVGATGSDGFDVTEQAIEDANSDDDGFHQRYGMAAFNTEIQGINLGYRFRINQGALDYDASFGPTSVSFLTRAHVLNGDYQHGYLRHAVNLAHTDEQQINDPLQFGQTYATARSFFQYRGDMRISESVTGFGNVSVERQDISDSSGSFSRTDRLHKAVNIGAVYQGPAWLFDGAVRFDDVSDYDSHVSYTLGAGYQINANVTVFANQATGFRVPTFSDLYPQGNLWVVANPELEPEQSRTQELGLKVMTDAMSVQIALYRQHIDEMIALDYDPNQGAYLAQNLDEALSEGLEIASTFNTGIVAHNVMFNVLTAEDDQGKALARRAKTQLNWQGSVAIENWQFALNTQYRSSRPTIAYFNETLASYVSVGGSVAYQLSDDLSVAINLDNAFDRDIHHAGYDVSDKGLLRYQTPGRQLSLRVVYQF